MNQQAVASKLLKSKEKLELALALTRTRHEVRMNHLTTSNLIPRGQYQPNDNHHESVVSPVVSDMIPKINHNLSLSRRTYENDYNDFDGRFRIEMGLHDVSELDITHGNSVRASRKSIDDLMKAIADDELSVIPLSKL